MFSMNLIRCLMLIPMNFFCTVCLDSGCECFPCDLGRCAPTESCSLLCVWGVDGTNSCWVTLLLPQQCLRMIAEVSSRFHDSSAAQHRRRGVRPPRLMNWAGWRFPLSVKCLLDFYDAVSKQQLVDPEDPRRSHPTPQLLQVWQTSALTCNTSRGTWDTCSRICVGFTN